MSKRESDNLDGRWNNSCPCGHDWDKHELDAGCMAGWEFEGPDPGIASSDGCMCQLAHVEKSKR